MSKNISPQSPMTRLSEQERACEGSGGKHKKTPGQNNGISKLSQVHNVVFKSGRKVPLSGSEHGQGSSGGAAAPEIMRLP